jgi:hypothetical protein
VVAEECLEREVLSRYASKSRFLRKAYCRQNVLDCREVVSRTLSKFTEVFIEAGYRRGYFYFPGP